MVPSKLITLASRKACQLVSSGPIVRPSVDFRFSGKLRELPLVDGVPSGIGVGVGGSSDATVTCIDTKVAVGCGVSVAVASATGEFDPHATRATSAVVNIASFRRVEILKILVTISPFCATDSGDQDASSGG